MAHVIEESIQLALDSLPDDVMRKISSVPIVVDDGRVPDGVAGLYVSFPEHIVLYEKWITEHVPDGQTLQECVFGVLMHEIGHALGMDHCELAECGV